MRTKVCSVFLQDEARRWQIFSRCFCFERSMRVLIVCFERPISTNNQINTRLCVYRHDIQGCCSNGEQQGHWSCHRQRALSAVPRCRLHHCQRCVGISLQHRSWWNEAVTKDLSAGVFAVGIKWASFVSFAAVVVRTLWRLWLQRDWLPCFTS